MKRRPILECKRIKYYSLKDEDAFFEWLYKIDCIEKIQGIYQTLYLHMKKRNIHDQCLRDLIAIFYRYKINMKQLQIFLNESNKDWFFEGDVKGYWYKRIFG